MNMIQVALLGVIGVLFAIQLKQEKSDVAICICIVISLLIFIEIATDLGTIVDTIREIEGYINIESSYIVTLIKMLGITYLAEFSSGICKDAGYHSISSQIEMFGKITIVVLSLPILLALLRTLQEFFG